MFSVTSLSRGFLSSKSAADKQSVKGREMKGTSSFLLTCDDCRSHGVKWPLCLYQSGGVFT